ncbi:MAG: hypothetical protein ACREBS_12055 [Nitrososphaerales archaeon]
MVESDCIALQSISIPQSPAARKERHENLTWLRPEIILAEEQGSAHKVNSFHSHTGTLILTNRRLVFLRGNDILFKVFGISVGAGQSFRMPDIGFAEVYDVSEIPEDLSDDVVSIGSGESLFIPLGPITNASSSKGGFTSHPSLKVDWAPSSLGIDPEEQKREKQEFRQASPSSTTSSSTNTHDVTVPTSTQTVTETTTTTMTASSNGISNVLNSFGNNAKSAIESTPAPVEIVGGVGAVIVGVVVFVGTPFVVAGADLIPGEGEENIPESWIEVQEGAALGGGIMSAGAFLILQGWQRL